MSVVNFIYTVLAILIATAIIAIVKTRFFRVKLRERLSSVTQLLKKFIKIIDKAIKLL